MCKLSFENWLEYLKAMTTQTTASTKEITIKISPEFVSKYEKSPDLLQIKIRFVVGSTIFKINEFLENFTDIDENLIDDYPENKIFSHFKNFDSYILTINRFEIMERLLTQEKFKKEDEKLTLIEILDIYLRDFAEQVLFEKIVDYPKNEMSFEKIIVESKFKQKIIDESIKILNL